MKISCLSYLKFFVDSFTLAMLPLQQRVASTLLCKLTVFFIFRDLSSWSEQGKFIERGDKWRGKSI
jgi:hypothetical protein